MTTVEAAGGGSGGAMDHHSLRHLIPLTLRPLSLLSSRFSSLSLPESAIIDWDLQVNILTLLLVRVACGTLLAATNIVITLRTFSLSDGVTD